MERKIIGTAAFLGITAIILGAFGAHALKNYLTVEQLVSFETGVRYQMYNALFLLFLGLSNAYLSEKAKKQIYGLVVLGVTFFSVSIYLLTTKSVTGIDFKFLGPITPIGGTLLIAAWIVLFVQIMKKKI
jgi:uncharacterized membrane protein YgdD (TMEM256/DUF423 family)